MVLPELLREIENRGVTLEPAGDRLRFRPKRNVTPELVEGLRQYKAEILERLERGEEPGLNSGPVPKAHHEPLIRDAGEAHESLLNNTVIRDTGEVLELARAHFGELEHKEDTPYPPHEGSGDPMVRTDTPKAQFFQGVRRRDRERREREGLPPWIRVVDGGAA